VLGEQYGRVPGEPGDLDRVRSGRVLRRLLAVALPDRTAHHPPLLEPIVADLRHSHPQITPTCSRSRASSPRPRTCRPAGTPSPRRCASGCARRRSSSGASIRWCRAAPPCATRWRRSLAAINGDKRNPRSFDRLEALLGDQAYRLSFWGVAAEEINYRRFFDINDLAAIRVELPNVLDAVHDKAFQLLRAGQGDGPARRPRRRPDGPVPLPREPSARQRARPRTGSTAPPPQSTPTDRLQTYVVAEKILVGDEVLPREMGRTRHHRLRVS
jgi:hypothetical protein